MIWSRGSHIHHLSWHTLPRSQFSTNHETKLTGGQHIHPAHNTYSIGNWQGDSICDTQADVPSTYWHRAQLAFKDSMVHGILQFTPSIAFRYVLHRCKSLDIRCRESFYIYHVSKHNTHENRLRCHAGVLRAKFKFLDAFSAGV
jgi:hypothetical protein